MTAAASAATSGSEISGGAGEMIRATPPLTVDRRPAGALPPDVFPFQRPGLPVGPNLITRVYRVGCAVSRDIM
jgi:hypothetical protein